MQVNEFLNRLENVKGGQGRWKARCPAHPDKTPSLSVAAGEDGKILVKCFGGCTPEKITAAMGLTMSDLYIDPPKPQGREVKEAEYLYTPDLKKVKYRKPDGSKVCFWYHKEGMKWVKGRKGINPGLYRSHRNLPDIFYLVEGEKDVENLGKIGLPAASLPDGAQSKWLDAYNAAFQGKQVIILPDNDEPGHKYAQMCASHIHGNAAAVWVLDLKNIWSEIPEKGDVSDLLLHFDADTAAQRLVDLARETKPWEPTQAPPDEATKKPSLMVTSAQDLQAANLPPTVFMIAGILPEGTSIISAASKIGKSWMVLDMGLSIAAGVPFMGKDVQQCGVLYLALEDSLSRLQDRMNKILSGGRAPRQFYFATEAPNLDNGLLDALDAHLKQFPETKLVIIDTLQKIRGRALPRESSYEQDYREMGTVKSYMDKKGVSVLFVHHNRKMKDEDDPFNMISGTNGIMGAADTIWAIIKGKRSDNEATLHITGRDVMQTDTVISFDKSSWKWKPIGALDLLTAQRERLAYDNNPIVKTIKELLKDEPEWRGTANELMNEGRRICKCPIAPTAQRVGLAFKELDALLLEYDGIMHQRTGNGSGGKGHYFFLQDWTEEVEQQEELPL